MGQIDDIRNKLDIVEIVGQTVRLEKKGTAYRGLCPFHSEKTPSFFVFPDSGRWRCFGCNRGGGVFDFVMERDHLTFRETINLLAPQAGIDLTPITPEQHAANEQQKRLRAILVETARFYHEQLYSPSGKDARDYLRGRKITKKTLDDWQLGYAAKNGLGTYLQGKGHELDECIMAGVIAQKDGRAYDFMRERLVIPIWDKHNQLVSFGGRALGESKAKYINGPQTPVFDKGSVLFGLHRAWDVIRADGIAIMVEGYFDVLMGHQKGLSNMLAPLGTTVTPAQLKALSKVADKLVLALDPDKAGQAAIETIAKVRREAAVPISLWIATLPDGLDPDEALLGGWRPTPIPVYQWILETKPRSTPAEKGALAKRLRPHLRDIADSVEREAAMRECANALGVTTTTLDQVTQASPPQQTRRTLPRADVEGYALGILLREGGNVLSDVDTYMISHNLSVLDETDWTGDYRLVWTAWLDAGEHELQLSEPLSKRVDEWIVAAPVGENLYREVLKVVLRQRDKVWRAHLQELSALVANGGPVPEVLKAIQETAKSLAAIEAAKRRV